MKRKDKLALGIEIVAAMKASDYDTDIETGRIMAIEDTEFNRVIKPKAITEEEKQKIINWCKLEKKRLYKQAFYVADITLKKLSYPKDEISFITHNAHRRKETNEISFNISLNDFDKIDPFLQEIFKSEKPAGLVKVTMERAEYRRHKII